MSLDPNLWGKSAWETIHYISFSYPVIPTENDKINFKNFIEILNNTLPCIICRSHFKKILTDRPLIDDILSDKKKLIYWCIDIHNDVNKNLNKKIYTYDEVLDIYLNEYKNKNSSIYILIFFILIFLIFLIFFV